MVHFLRQLTLVHTINKTSGLDVLLALSPLAHIAFYKYSNFLTYPWQLRPSGGITGRAKFCPHFPYLTITFCS